MTENVKSIPGVSDEAFRLLSPRQRQRLSAEVEAGRKATEQHKEAADHNRKLMEQAGGDSTTPMPDADELTIRQAADRKLASMRAAQLQEVAIRNNNQKALFDEYEAREGHGAVVKALAEKLGPATEELVKQRYAQAVENNEASGEMSEQQKVAAHNNAAKEIADRTAAATGGSVGPEAGLYTGSISPIAVETPVFDGEGKVMGVYGTDGVYKANENYEPSEAEKQRLAMQASVGANVETTTSASSLMDDLTGDQPSKSRRSARRATADRAAGDGPTSE